MVQKEKYIGESKLLGEAKKKLILTLGDRVVTTSKLADKSVTVEKLADNIVDLVIKPVITKAVKEALKELGLEHIAMVKQE